MIERDGQVGRDDPIERALNTLIKIDCLVKGFQHLAHLASLFIVRFGDLRSAEPLSRPYRVFNKFARSRDRKGTDLKKRWTLKRDTTLLR